MRLCPSALSAPLVRFSPCACAAARLSGPRGARAAALAASPRAHGAFQALPAARLVPGGPLAPGADRAASHGLFPSDASLFSCAH